MTDDESSYSQSVESGEDDSENGDNQAPMLAARYLERDSLIWNTTFEFGRRNTFRAHIDDSGELVLTFLRPRMTPRVLARFAEYLGFWFVEGDDVEWLWGFMVVRINEWLYLLVDANRMVPFQTSIADEEIEQVYYYYHSSGALCVMARTQSYDIAMPELFRLPRSEPGAAEPPSAGERHRILETPEEVSVYVFDQKAADNLGDSFDLPLSNDIDLTPWTSESLLRDNTKQHFERAPIVATRAC